MAEETQSNNLFYGLLKAVKEFLEPLLDAFTTSDGRQEILESLGLNAQAASTGPNLPATGALNQYLEVAEKEVKPLELAAAMGDLVLLLATVEGFIEAAKTDDDERALSEIITALLNYLTLEYVRHKAPALHSFIRLVAALDEKTVAEGGLTNFFKDTVVGYFSLLGKTMENEESTTALSQGVFFTVAGGLYFVDHLLKKYNVVNDLEIRSGYGFEGLRSSATPVADGIADRALSFSIINRFSPIDKEEVYITTLFVPKDQGGEAFVFEVHGKVALSIPLSNADPKLDLLFDLNGDGIFRLGASADAIPGANNKSSVALKHTINPPARLKIFDTPSAQFGVGTYQIILSVAPDDVEIKWKGNLAYQFGRGGGTGFPINLLPENQEGLIPLEVGYSVKRGPFVGGSSANTNGGSSAPAQNDLGTEIVKFFLNLLSVRIPLHVTIGGIVGLETLYLRSDLNDDLSHVGLETSLDFWVKFGSPLTISISRLGVILALNKEANGPLHGYSFKPDFKPPTGAGVRVDAGVVTGGGFLYFDSAKGEYFGSLELSFKGMFALKAVGIINTKMPDGSEGFSLLIIITAEFSAVQLGFGFTLLGVGGLLGLNRTMDVEALRVGLRTGAIKSVLFPEDVVGNIQRIISDIRQIFPVKEDHFIIGLMGKIGWGTPTLLSIELGLLIELPDPRIVLLGVIKCVLPDEKVPLLKLQVNFLGVLDFQNEFIYFEARLFESQLVGFPLTGSLAFVVAWGRQSTFGISVGGFHPDFRDYPTVPTLPGAFRDMDRVSLQLLSGDNPRLGVECYFAVTSNSVQFGAKAELYAGGPMGFNLYGMLAFDALFIFNPFHFIISLEATLAIRHDESILFGIHFKGLLSGPTPWHVEGEVSFSICWFITITIGFSATWGDPPPLPDTATEDLLEILRKEIADLRNWRVVLPDYHNLHVTLRELEPEEKTQLIIHPFGQLVFSQRALPLNYTIQQYGNHKPKDVNFFKITGVSLGDTPAGELQIEREMFAPGNYTELSETQKLSSKSFELMQSGVQLSDAGNIHIPESSLAPVELDYELDYTGDDNPQTTTSNKLNSTAFDHLSRSGSAAKSAVSWRNTQANPLNGPENLKFEDPGFVLVSAKDLSPIGANLEAATYAEASQMMDHWLMQNPGKAGEVLLVHDFEVNH